MRRPITALLLLSVLALPALAAVTPAAALDLGVRAFRAGDYNSAIADLAAAAAGLSPAGDAVAYETSLVYLALSQFRLGREEEARDTILRLADAERTVAVFATLPIEAADVADLRTLAAALAPQVTLPATRATDERLLPLPAVRPATPAVIDETALEAERLRIQREADARVARADADARAELERRIAQIEAEARARVAAIEEDARRRIAAAEAAAPGTTVAVVAPQPVTEVDSATHREYLMSLRQADALGAHGQTLDATRIYLRIANGANVPREVLTEAVIGLYRTGAFREAVDAFTRFGTFLRGEEDLRYYNAVALFEIGEYERARKELACALPFIEITEEVARYRIKIERSGVPQTASR